LPAPKVTRIVSLLVVVVASAMGLLPLPVEGRLSSSVAPSPDGSEVLQKPPYLVVISDESEAHLTLSAPKENSLGKP